MLNGDISDNIHQILYYQLISRHLKIENLKLSLIEMENSLTINLSATIVEVQTQNSSETLHQTFR